MKKVAHILRKVDGGAPVVASNIVKNLTGHDFMPMVFFDTSATSPLRRELEASAVETVWMRPPSETPAAPLQSLPPETHFSNKIQRLAGPWGKDAYLSTKSALRFLRRHRSRVNTFLELFREHKVTLVHTHSNLVEAKPELIAARKAGIPCVLHCHTARFYNTFDRSFSRLVDAFIFISRFVFEGHQRQSPKNFNGAVIHNGIDPEAFQKGHVESLLRKTFRIPSDHCLAGIVGRLVWWKGQDAFIEAVARASKRVPVTGIIIGGAGNGDANQRNDAYAESLKSEAESLGLAKNIIFTGHRTDIDSIVPELDVLIHAASEPEPFGLTVIEGMAAGKPVIATAAGGILDIITDGHNGLLVPPKNPEAMAEALVRLASSSEQRIALGNNAMKTVREKFTIHRQVEAVAALYDSLLRKQAGNAS